MLLQEKLPAGYVIRSATREDFPAIVDLMQASERSIIGEATTDVDELTVFFSIPGFNLETDSWLLYTETNKLIGVYVVMLRPPVRAAIDGCFHPDHRDDRLQAMMIGLAEDRAKAWIAQAPEGLRFYSALFCEARDVQSTRLHESLGYKLVRSFLHMKIDLQEAPPIAQWSEGIRIATVSGPEQYQAVYEAQEEFFQDHWGHTPSTKEKWLNFGPDRVDGNFDLGLQFLAMDGDQIAAVALCCDEKARGGWVNELAVGRRWRRRGIGMALLHHAFGEFYQRGIKEVYLNVDSESLTGATRLYERAGMHVVRQYLRFEKDLRPGRELELRSLG